MFRPYPSEEFKEIPFDLPQLYRYALSNRGRVIRFKNEFSDGDIYNCKLTSGYQVIVYRTESKGKIVRKPLFVYKVFAQYFVPKESEDQEHVLHLDFERANDKPENLKWATTRQRLDHHATSPHVAEARRKRAESDRKSDGWKLTTTQVIRLKKMLADPNRKTRLRILAKQFGISEMQLYRIKSGENWSHITI